MKKNTPLLLSLILTILLFSCKDSKERKEKTIITEVSSNAPITAKVNGVLLNTSEMDSYAVKGSSSKSTFLTLMGSSMKGLEIQAISINIYQYKGIGKYKIGATEANTSLPTIGSYTKSIIGIPPKTEAWFSKEGEIEITEEKNGRIKGIFNFTTKKGDKQGDKINITEGKFSLKLSN